jgi:hypothetical protein
MEKEKKKDPLHILHFPPNQIAIPPKLFEKKMGQSPTHTQKREFFVSLLKT